MRGVAAALPLGLLLAAAGVAPASAGPVRVWSRTVAASPAPVAPPHEAGYGDEGAYNAFFYPDGYDPQYGSEGRVPDAADFAADYGCRPIWNAKVGHLTRACN